MYESYMIISQQSILHVRIINESVAVSRQSIGTTIDSSHIIVICDIIFKTKNRMFRGEGGSLVLLSTVIIRL